MDGKGAKIQVTVRRRFMDHVWLQLWSRWSTLPMAVMFSLFAVFAGMTIAGSRNQISYLDVVNRMAQSWWFAAAVVLIGLAAVIALQLMPHLFTWVLGQTPREVTFTFDDPGITYSAGDASLLIRWPSVKLYAESSAALFITTKRAAFRLPKRSFESGSLDATRAFLASKNIRRVPVWRFI